MMGVVGFRQALEPGGVAGEFGSTSRFLIVDHDYELKAIIFKDEDFKTVAAFPREAIRFGENGNNKDASILPFDFCIVDQNIGDGSLDVRGALSGNAVRISRQGRLVKLPAMSYRQTMFRIPDGVFVVGSLGATGVINGNHLRIIYNATKLFFREDGVKLGDSRSWRDIMKDVPGASAFVEKCDNNGVEIP